MFLDSWPMFPLRNPNLEASSFKGNVLVREDSFYPGKETHRILIHSTGGLFLLVLALLCALSISCDRARWSFMLSLYLFLWLTSYFKHCTMHNSDMHKNHCSLHSLRIIWLNAFLYVWQCFCLHPLLPRCCITDGLKMYPEALRVLTEIFIKVIISLAGSRDYNTTVLQHFLL